MTSSMPASPKGLSSAQKSTLRIRCVSVRTIKMLLVVCKPKQASNKSNWMQLLAAVAVRMVVLAGVKIINCDSIAMHCV